ncbi:sensor histidine kinase [Mangrovicella endophytica]|uniref:sensor histidine kinase n=1 Tax=Mangrovicella endophytica TaxID=2066697 RepID=UPI000C9E55F6|nr:sensor histidine kinase [Mangrovicella endophytica]
MTAGAETAPRTLSNPRPFSLSRGLRRPPLIAHLVGFAVIVLIPALLFSALLIMQFSRQQGEIAVDRASGTAEIITNAIDREILAMTTTARVLASAPLESEADLKLFHDRTGTAMQEIGGSAALVDPSFNVVLTTRDTFPGPATMVTQKGTIERALSTRKPQISDVFYSERAGSFLFHVAVPVLRDNRPIYVLLISKNTDDLGPAIAAVNLPATWSAIVKDREGHRVFAALATEGRMRPRQEVSYDNPSIAEALGDRMAEDRIEASYSSALSGWTTIVAVPEAAVNKTATRSWLLLIAAGVLLLAFCVMLAFYFGRRIATPILRLSHQANLIGKGELALPIRTDIAEIGEVSKVLAQASRDRREAEEQNRFLMREMTHRAKNQYALIAAIARRAAKESADTNQFLATLSEALASLARSADLLASKGWDSAALKDLVLAQLDAFGARASGQIVIDGPDIKLNPTAAQTIGLALHELATNAAKYGALSAEAGVVHVTWSVSSGFDLTWRESGGPPVVEPKRSGFGTLVTQKMTARGLGGSVDMDYAPEGVVWHLKTPMDSILVH